MSATSSVDETAKPLLITGFTPDLSRPELLSKQIEALEKQIDSRSGAIVLLAQSSYGSLIRRRQDARRGGELDPSSPLRKLTNLLAPFSVHFFHDTNLRDQATNVSKREDFEGNLLAAYQPGSDHWWPLGEVRLYDRRCRRLFEVLYEEGRPTRQLQRVALRLIDLPKNDACTAEQIISQVGLAAGPYYEAIWASCDTEERIVLAQLAWEGVANPKAYETILDLLQKGLICRDPALRLMNRSFGRFVQRALPRWQLVELEEESGTSAWSILKWLLPLPLLLLGGFLFLTQQDAVSNVIGLAIAIGSLVPTFINFYHQFQQTSVARARGAGDAED